MTDYEQMWRQTCAELEWYKEQNARLKGDAKENPTLRDQFAMAVLNGYCAHHGAYTGPANNDLALYAYDMADAMMLRREAK